MSRRRPRGMSEIEAAHMMAARECHWLCHGEGVGWHRWTGTHWTRADAEIEAERAVEHCLGADVSKRNAFIRGAVSAARRQDGIHVPAADWNQERGTLFNVRNGVLDLVSGDLRDHDPADRFLGVANVEWQEGARSASWDAFLQSILPDEAERRLLQAFLGFSLTDWVMDHHFLMLIGPPGSGKSTLVEALAGVMGSLACRFDSQILMRNWTGHETALMQFRGKRLAFASEIARGASVNTARLNELTGDEQITGHLMRQDHVTFRRTHKTILVGNHRPHFGDTMSDGLRRRLILLEPQAVPEEERDPMLPRELAKPESRSAILRWMVEGLRLFVADGHQLQIPDSVAERNCDAFEADDPLAEFLADKPVKKDANGFIPTDEVHRLFVYHCDQTGRKRLSQRALVDKLKRRGWPRPLQRRDGDIRRRGFAGLAWQ